MTPLLVGSVAAAVVAVASGQRWAAAAIVIAWLLWLLEHRPTAAGTAATGRRLFSEADRAAIFVRARGRCEHCQVRLHWQRSCSHGGCDRCFHADHVVAWSVGGETALANGQALCRACNLAKSDG